MVVNLVLVGCSCYVSGQRGCELSETCRRLGPPEPESESGPTSADAEAFQWFMT